MSYGKFAIDCLRSDLGFYREIDRAWVIVYQGSGHSDGPLYFKDVQDDGDGLKAGSIKNCVLFGTYEEACEAAQRSNYIRKLSPNLRRIVQITIEVVHRVDMLEDRPIGVLDALAEIKP